MRVIPIERWAYEELEDVDSEDEPLRGVDLNWPQFRPN